MLKATLAGDMETMAGILKFVHDTESLILVIGISYDRRTKEHFCKVEQIK